MLNAIKHITDDIFLSGRQCIGAHALCVQHSPTAAALSTYFLLNNAANSPELNALVTRFRESYSSMSMSRESERLKKSRSDWLNSGNALIQHLSEKMRFSCFPICQVVQQHTLFEVTQ